MPGLVVVMAILSTLFRIVLILRDLLSQWDVRLSILHLSFRLHHIRVCIKVLRKDPSLFRGVRELIYLQFKSLLVVIMHFQLQFLLFWRLHGLL